jgi:hypothetical protein
LQPHHALLPAEQVAFAPIKKNNKVTIEPCLPAVVTDTSFNDSALPVGLTREGPLAALNAALIE